MGMSRVLLLLSIFSVSVASAQDKTPHDQAIWAIENHNAGQMKDAIKRGIDVSDPQYLHGAVTHGACHLVNQLARAGADLQARDASGRSLVDLAFDTDAATVRHLLVAGAEIETRHLKRYMGIASDWGAVFVAKFLVEAGATPPFFDDRETFLRMAKGNSEMAGAILRLSNDNANGICYALVKDLQSVVDSFIAKGGRLNTRVTGDAVSDLQSRVGRTALMCAETDELEQLLKSGADPNLAADSGQLPLQLYVNSDEAVELLLARGARVNQRGAEEIDDAWVGASPLFSAARTKKYRSLDLMINAGARVNEPADNGWTPLYYAIRQGHVSLALRLISAGGRLQSPAAAAELLEPVFESGNNELIGWLVPQVDSGSISPDRLATCDGELVDLLLNLGVDPRQATAPILPVVAQCEERRHFTRLLEAGADLNAQDEEGRTALMIFAGERNPVFRDLIAAGANQELTDRQGEKAWQYYWRSLSANNTSMKIRRRELCVHLRRPPAFQRQNEVPASMPSGLISLVLASGDEKPVVLGLGHDLVHETSAEALNASDWNFQQTYSADSRGGEIQVGHQVDGNESRRLAFIDGQPGPLAVALTGSTAMDIELGWMMNGFLSTVELQKPWGFVDSWKSFWRIERDPTKPAGPNYAAMIKGVMGLIGLIVAFVGWRKRRAQA